MNLEHLIVSESNHLGVEGNKEGCKTQVVGTACAYIHSM